MPQPAAPSADRFTLPGDIPDAAYWAPGDRLEDAVRRRDAARAGDAAKSRAFTAPAKAVARGGAAALSAAAGSGTRGNDPEGRGYAASHPAGRGWVPQSRDLGIPSEHAGGAPLNRTVTVEHVFPDGYPDDPVAALGHGSVFTRELRVRFLDYLAFKGNVRAAAMRVGVSHKTAYRARRQDAAFAALWDAALVHARSYSEQVLATRALDGTEVNIWHRGELVGHDVRHDPRLLLAHLGRLDRRLETDFAAVARAGQFDDLLAAYAGQPAPEGFAQAAEEARALQGKAAAPHGLPPTRDAYLAYARGLAMDSLAPDDDADPAEDDFEARQAAETELAAEWGEEAAEIYDAWHADSLATVGALVGEPCEAETDSEDQPEDRPEDHSETPAPLPPTGGAGGEPAAPTTAMSPIPASTVSTCPAEEGQAPAGSERERDGGEGAANPVTSVNPGPENRPETSPEMNPETSPETSKVETAAAIAHSAAVTRVTNEGERETMNMFLKRFPLKAVTAAMGAFALSAPAVAQFGGPPPPPNTGVPFSTNLTSWDEVPGPGNGAGSGRVTVVVDPPKGQLCYMFFDVYGIGAATAAHVHVGVKGQAGNPVATLKPPVDGSSSGCQPIAADLAQAIVANPAGYYVNVHTAEFPNGALRGQLSG